MANSSSALWRRGRRFVALVAIVSLAPLAALMVLQYLWLQRLESASAAAQRASLESLLEAVAGGLETHYRGLGERLLNLPPTVLGPEAAAEAFRRKEVAGVRRLFVASYGPEAQARLVAFDPRSLAVVEAPLEETRAEVVATASWRVLAAKGVPFDRPALQVDERDPAERMILNPISDAEGRVVGVAGLVIDPRDFEERVLPAQLREAVGRFAGEGLPEPRLEVLDGNGRRLAFVDGRLEPVMTAPAAARPADAARALGFLFRDWQLVVRSAGASPAEGARRTFALQLGLSALLALGVALGLFFALSTAARSLRLSQMKSDFVSNVSHELRTPLASIRVFGELLRLNRAESPAAVRRYGEWIETESRRLTHLVDNLLDLARLESGRKLYRFQPEDLEEVVRGVVASQRPALEAAGFELRWQPPAAGLPPVRLDAAAIGQAIGNLLDNAVKYAGDTKVIEVAVERRGEDAVVTVRDQGIGIPPSEQGKIFDRFHRVATGLVHDVQGSGLGLAIVRHAAEAHGGRVEVESQLGEGSTFRLVIPLGRAGGAAAEAEPETGRIAEA